MVATDVASRGIGMIDHGTALSFPLLSFVSCVAACYALLSTILRSYSAIQRSRLVLSFVGSLIGESWILDAV